MDRNITNTKKIKPNKISKAKNPFLRKAKRKEVNAATIRKLFSLTCNKCALPTCNNTLIYEEFDDVRAEICHIQAATPGGPRFTKSKSDKELASFNNLIVLCKNCHDEIDKNPKKYDTEILFRIKNQHEKKCKKTPYQIPDSIIDRISINVDQFTYEEILWFFKIYSKIKDPIKKEYYYRNRIVYCLKNLKLTKEDETKQYRDIVHHIAKLDDNGFADLFLEIESFMPLHIKEEFVTKYETKLVKDARNKLVNSTNNDKDEKRFAKLFWLLKKSNINLLVNDLIDNHTDYTTTMKSIIEYFEDHYLNSLSLDDKLNIQEKIWNKMESLKDTDPSYSNLLELDRKIFNSLQQENDLSIA